MALPPKIQSGQNLRVSVVNTVNAIIGYLRDNAVVGDNDTIKVQRTAAGLVVRAIPQNAARRQTPQNGAGGSADLRLCVPTVAPNGGAGAATVAEVTLLSDGTWTATATTHAVTVPELG